MDRDQLSLVLAGVTAGLERFTTSCQHTAVELDAVAAVLVKFAVAFVAAVAQDAEHATETSLAPLRRAIVVGPDT